MALTITRGGLREELRDVEHDYPGWHLFTSDAGTVWAATTENHAGGSGTTLDAPTPDGMRHEIACQIHQWGQRECGCGDAA
jgi:hypothetical protein